MLENKNIPVSERLLEQLVDTLASSPSDLATISPQMREWISQVERVAWKLRVSPLSPALKKFELMAGELAQSEHKQIRCEFPKPLLEAPEPIIQMISLILLHSIRNSVHHGIESPGERESLGKAKEGLFKLQFGLSMGWLRFKIQDDGKGPSFAALRKHAKKVFTQDLKTSSQPSSEMKSEPENWSDEKLLTLLFEPGFSTASRVTQAAGRGIGLDAISSAVKELGGQIKAIAPVSGGFLLDLSFPVSPLGMEATLIRLKDFEFWVPTEQLQTVSAEEKLNFPSLLTYLSETESLVKLRSPFDGIKILKCQEVGSSQYQFFRPLEKTVLKLLPPEIQRVWELTQGHVLASKLKNKLVILIDHSLLMRLFPEN